MSSAWEKNKEKQFKETANKKGSMKENEIACSVNERFRNRSRNGGFISRPHHTSTACDQTFQNTRNGGFVAWPVNSQRSR